MLVAPPGVNLEEVQLPFSDKLGRRLQFVSSKSCRDLSPSPLPACTNTSFEASNTDDQCGLGIC